MKNEKKPQSVELTRSESNLIEATIQLMSKVKAEIVEKTITESIMREYLSTEMRKLAEAKGLKGKEFEYRDGTIIVSVEDPGDPTTSGDPAPEKDKK